MANKTPEVESVDSTNSAAGTESNVDEDSNKPSETQTENDDQSTGNCNFMLEITQKRKKVLFLAFSGKLLQARKKEVDT